MGDATPVLFFLVFIQDSSNSLKKSLDFIAIIIYSGLLSQSSKTIDCQ
jgi:hypothetical protein